MTDTVNEIPLEKQTTQEDVQHSTKKKKKSMVQELQELRQKLKEAEQRSHAVEQAQSGNVDESLPDSRNTIPSTPTQEKKVISDTKSLKKTKSKRQQPTILPLESDSSSDDDYFYIPKHIWEERNEYLKKVIEKKKNLKKTIESLKVLKQNSYSEPYSHYPQPNVPIYSPHPQPQLPQYYLPPSQNSSKNSIINEENEVYSQVLEKKPFHQHTQKMLHYNRVDAPKTVLKKTETSMRDKITK